MNCQEFNGLHIAFLDDEVTPQEGEMIRRHLESCPLCREELNELAGTRVRLRQTLSIAALGDDYSRHAWGKIREGIDMDGVKPQSSGGLSGFFPRRPAWKWAAFSLASVIVLVGAAITIPSLFGDDKGVMAREIATTDQNVMNIFDDESIVSSRVVDIQGNVFTIEVIGTGGTQTQVKVDMGSRSVTEIIIGPAGNFEDEEIETIFAILQADDAVKALFDQGATIKSISNYFLAMKPAKIGEGEGEITSKKVHVTIALGEGLYLADIELVSGSLLGFGEYDAMQAQSAFQYQPTMATPGASNSPIQAGAKSDSEIIVTPAENFQDGDIDKIIAILNKNEDVKALFNQGAMIRSITNYFLALKPGKVGEDLGELTQNKVHVTIALGEALYLADVELVSGTLLGFGEYDEMKSKTSNELAVK